jgi:hypothetical protein
MNELGEPYTGKPSVRFDERRSLETGTDNYGQFNPSGTALPTLSKNNRCYTNPALKRR